MNKKLELISNYNPSLRESDPELTDILDNFLSKQVFEESTLSDRERLMVTIACQIANQSIKLYENIVKIALDIGVTPIEIKEILYHSLVYIGLSKSYEFIDKTNEIFKELNIKLPLEEQATVKYEDRQRAGYDIQVRNFGKEFIDSSMDSAPEGQKHLWTFINTYAFGDFYTRNGLSDQDRELISFTYILSLRGCENQLDIHTKGNLQLGNDKEKLVSVVTVLIPYIGFPRAHNALAIVNRVCDELE